MKQTKPNTAATAAPTEILPGLWWIARGAWGGVPALTNPGCGNVYMLVGKRRCVLIDSGVATSRPSIEAKIQEAGAQPSDVAEIWITHSHWDHFAGARAWQEKYPRCKVRLCRRGVEMLRKGDQRLVGSAIVGLGLQPVPRRMAALDHGQRIACASFDFKVIAMPGHTADCMGFRGKVAGVDCFFTGDAIIGDQPIGKGVIGWLDGLWLSDVPSYKRTLEAAAAHPPQLMLPGHGLPSTGAAVARSIRNCQNRLAQLMAIPHLDSMLPVFNGP